MTLILITFLVLPLNFIIDYFIWFLFVLFSSQTLLRTCPPHPLYSCVHFSSGMNHHQTHSTSSSLPEIEITFTSSHTRPLRILSRGTRILGIIGFPSAIPLPVNLFTIIQQLFESGVPISSIKQLIQIDLENYQREHLH